MIGTATKFPNTSRVISGQVNFVFDSDLILLCNTSSGAVNLLLLEIPENHFNTQYKLYVVDNSNNAVNNNITITAPTGYTIQGSNTAKITSNGGVCIVTISSNKSYSAFFSYNEQGNPLIIKNEGANITPNATSLNFVGSSVEASANGTDVTVTVTSSGNPIAVKNEGTEITPTALSLNFVGNLVNATSVAGAVQIDINSSFLTVTYAVLQTLISTNALIPNQNYLIVDAIFINTTPQDYTITKTASIIVKAITINEISLSGSGIFLNADYQNIGNYSGVSGFTVQTGIYNPNNSGYNVGDVIIWNNLHWKFIGTPPAFGDGGISLYENLPTVNPSENSSIWQLLTQTSTNGYVTEIDIIKYDVAVNKISYREDVRNNKVENNLNVYGDDLEAFYYFQWGKNSCICNSISTKSVFVCWNSIGVVRYNTLDKNSTIFSSTQFTNNVEYNYCTFNCSFSLSNKGYFINNTLENCGLVITNEGSFENNNLRNCNGTVVNSPNGQIRNNTFHKQLEYSNGLIITNSSNINNNQLIDFNTFTVVNSAYDGQNGLITDNVINQNAIIIIADNKANIKANTFSNCKIQINDTFSGAMLNNTVTGNNEYNDETAGVVIGNTGGSVVMQFLENELYTSSVELLNGNGNFRYNNFSRSKLSLSGETNIISSNTWRGVEVVITSNAQSPAINNTTVCDANLYSNSQLNNFAGGILQKGINTIKYQLDMENPTIYDVVNQVLTIPEDISGFFGEYELLSNTSFDIKTIINLSTRWATKFTNAPNPDFPNAKRFVVLPSLPLGLTPNQLLSPNTPQATVTYYFNLGANNGSSGFYDSIYLRNLGAYNGIEQFYNYRWVSF